MFVLFRKPTHISSTETQISLASSLEEAKSIFIDKASKIGQVLLETTDKVPPVDENKFVNDQIVFVEDKNEANVWIEQKVTVSTKDTGVLWSNIQKEYKFETVAHWGVMEIPNVLIKDWLLKEEKTRIEEMRVAKESMNFIRKARKEREEMERDTKNLEFIKSKYEVKSTECMDYSLAHEIRKSFLSLSEEAKDNLHVWCYKNSGLIPPIDETSVRLDLVNLLGVIEQDLRNLDTAHRHFLYAAERGYPLAIRNLVAYDKLCKRDLVDTQGFEVDTPKWIAKLKESGYEADFYDH